MLELSAPITVEWETTPDCNHRCLHCYNYWRDKDGSVTPSISQLDQEEIYFKTISEIINNRVLRVVVTGGEPLLVFDRIYPYILALKHHHIAVEINSNLTLLTPAVAKKIKALNIPILVSVPSFDPQTTALITNSPKAFAQIEKGIKLALKYRLKLTANMVVTQVNLKQIYLTAAYVKKLGITDFGATKSCTPVNCPDFSPYILTLEQTRSIFTELARIKKQLHLHVDSFIGYPTCIFTSKEMVDTCKARTCLAGRFTSTIGNNGDIRACAHLDNVYGNVTTDGLYSAWQKMNQWRDGSLTPKQCRSCKLVNSCVGGCKVESLKRFGKPNYPDPYADFTVPVEKLFPSVKTEFQQPKGRYIINPKLIFRKEDSGGILVTKERLIRFNDNLFGFFKEKIGQLITPNDLAKEFNWDTQGSLSFYSRLIEDGALVKQSSQKKFSPDNLDPFC